MPPDSLPIDLPPELEDFRNALALDIARARQSLADPYLRLPPPEAASILEEQVIAILCSYDSVTSMTVASFRARLADHPELRRDQLLEVAATIAALRAHELIDSNPTDAG